MFTRGYHSKPPRDSSTKLCWANLGSELCWAASLPRCEDQRAAAGPFRPRGSVWLVQMRHDPTIHCLPSGKLSHNYGKITIFNGKTHYKWPFSIARLNYQRVMMLDVLFKPNINIHQNFGPQIKANLSEFDHFKVGSARYVGCLNIRLKA